MDPQKVHGQIANNFMLAATEQPPSKKAPTKTAVATIEGDSCQCRTLTNNLFLHRGASSAIPPRRAHVSGINAGNTYCQK